MIKIFYVIAIITIWLSLIMMVVTLFGGITFIFKHMQHTDVDNLPALKRYPDRKSVV